ncbi:hypothetical protein [Cellulosilyticum sp. I15G10I2]|uniref:hypothetical protein n=1 Tax=Cellulosilyticum sp. I15G10I2 TaxID=1892843 RepID=UPI00085C215C|nr:hypothetical protein [Cellulosilyticum sp. I15G10I2]
MKKSLALLLTLSLVPFTLVGCGGKNNTPASAETPVVEAPAETPAETPAENVAADAVKTGLAVITTAGKSKDAGEQDGLAQVDSTIIAVTVDKDGRIVKCAIDGAQTKINFSKTGEVTTDLSTIFVGKQEMGTEYGMGKVSSLGKEWNEQANSLAEYVIGKTVDEIKAIAVDETTAPTDAELTASVTIKIGGYIEAIEKAVANAQDLGASSSDKLGLGVVTNIAKSKNAADEDGTAQAYTTYTATTFDADGKITSSIIDGSVSNVKFSKEGKVTSDIKAAYKTKLELGAEYGMAKASALGKEWFEQSTALSQYLIGKSLDEVKGIAVNEKGAPADSELAASVTVSIGDYIAVIEKASVSAR